jgi:hypothetical protein
MAITKETQIDKIEVVGDYKACSSKNSYSNQRRWKRIIKKFS